MISKKEYASLDLAEYKGAEYLSHFPVFILNVTNDLKYQFILMCYFF
uniref:Uncharacterized protein n=1 Tax=Anguilla anguilla TaxID=7936 RepID=A0A0E9TME2_ANGAN